MRRGDAKVIRFNKILASQGNPLLRDQSTPPVLDDSAKGHFIPIEDLESRCGVEPIAVVPVSPNMCMPSSRSMNEIIQLIEKSTKTARDDVEAMPTSYCARCSPTHAPVHNSNEATSDRFSYSIVAFLAVIVVLSTVIACSTGFWSRERLTPIAAAVPTTKLWSSLFGDEILCPITKFQPQLLSSEWEPSSFSNVRIILSIFMTYWLGLIVMPGELIRQFTHVKFNCLVIFVSLAIIPMLWWVLLLPLALHNYIQIQSNFVNVDISMYWSTTFQLLNASLLSIPSLPMNISLVASITFVICGYDTKCLCTAFVTGTIITFLRPWLAVVVSAFLIPIPPTTRYPTMSALGLWELFPWPFAPLLCTCSPPSIMISILWQIILPITSGVITRKLLSHPVVLTQVNRWTENFDGRFGSWLCDDDWRRWISPALPISSIALGPISSTRYKEVQSHELDRKLHPNAAETVTTKFDPAIPDEGKCEFNAVLNPMLRATGSPADEVKLAVLPPKPPLQPSRWYASTIIGKSSVSDIEEFESVWLTVLYRSILWIFMALSVLFYLLEISQVQVIGISYQLVIISLILLMVLHSCSLVVGWQLFSTSLLNPSKQISAVIVSSAGGCIPSFRPALRILASITLTGAGIGSSSNVNCGQTAGAITYNSCEQFGKHISVGLLVVLVSAPLQLLMLTLYLAPVMKFAPRRYIAR